MAIANQTQNVGRFVARLEKLGVLVHRAGAESADVAAAVLEALRSVEARLVIVADDLGPSRDYLLEALSAAGIATIQGGTAADADPADAGVTRAQFGIAETGSIAALGSELQPRLGTMLPPVHVALLDTEAVYPSLDEAGAHLEQAMAPGGPVQYASFITGPSRTADVEKTLALGVHGPRELHVVLIDGAR